MSSPNFRVIIVGGGITGLALANALQHANIDYVVLEKRETLDPQTGAAIGILPNGARILDQLGCYEDLNAMTVGMDTSATRRSDGSVIGEISDTLQLMRLRTGYSVFFIDRSLLLKVLSDHIREPKRVHVQKGIKSIETLSDKVVVHCDDGTTFEGDIVVGADGVHSRTRQEMWKQLESEGLESRIGDDRNALSAEYKCLFGISNGMPNMTPGQADRTYAKGMSTLSYVGKGGRIFWFVFAKMDKTYYPPNIPRFSPEDAEKLAKDIGSLCIREKGSVTVAKLFENRVTCSLVPIEEGDFQCWSHGRIACLGDSIHKMTPNLGAGATSGIESAATLASTIVRMVRQAERPSVEEITSAFGEYQRSRSFRVRRAMKFTNALTRIQALKTTRDFINTHYIAPRMGDFAAEMFSSFVIGAAKIDYLPVPERSIRGTMPFNPEHGWGFEELPSRRARRALPLFICGLVSAVLGYSSYRNGSAATNALDLTSHSDVWSRFIHISMFQEVMYGIWFSEGTRLNLKGTVCQIPLLFALAAQYLGISSIAPVYLALLYINSPIEGFRAADNRLTDTSYTSAITPLLIFTHVLPYLLATDSVQSTEFHIATWAGSQRPVVISLGLTLFATFLLPSTIQNDRLQAVRRDVPWVRATGAALIGFSLVRRVAWLASVLAPASTLTTLLPFAATEPALALGWTDLTNAFAVLAWVTLTVRDLHRAGMIQWGPARIAFFWVFTMLAFGPSVTLGAAWLMREEILLKRHHKAAVTKKTVELDVKA